MLVVAGVEWYGSAFEAVCFVLIFVLRVVGLAYETAQFYYFDFAALFAGVVVVVGAGEVGEDVVVVAFQHHAAFLVAGDYAAVLEAVLAEPYHALSIEVVLFCAG